MDGPRHERRKHFRGKSRPGRILPVRFQVGGATGEDDPWIDAATKNIGVGGAFIATSHVQAVSQTLIVEVRLPTTDQTFILPAVVRWSAPEGIGVQFVGVDVDVLLELNDFFSSLTTPASSDPE